MRISDWSSDVCSSDLILRSAPWAGARRAQRSDLDIPANGIAPDRFRHRSGGASAERPRGNHPRSSRDRSNYCLRSCFLAAAPITKADISMEERRVGKEGDSSYRFRASTDNKKT